MPTPTDTSTVILINRTIASITPNATPTRHQKRGPGARTNAFTRSVIDPYECSGPSRGPKPCSLNGGGDPTTATYACPTAGFLLGTVPSVVVRGRLFRP